jgi:cytochrome c oxidase subunit III
VFVPGIETMSTASLPQTRRWLMGLYFFLASLAVLFLSAILAMLLVRSSDLRPEPPLPVNVPASLWVSAVFLVVISLGLDRAVAALRRERQTQFRLAIVAVWLAVLGFLWLQFAGLTELLERHNQSPARDPRSYGLVYAIVMLHAVHVVGGLPPLAIVTWRGFRGRYDHEWNTGPRACAIYWHFLGLVWLALLGTFACLH